MPSLPGPEDSLLGQNIEKSRRADGTLPPQQFTSRQLFPEYVEVLPAKPGNSKEIDTDRLQGKRSKPKRKRIRKDRDAKPDSKESESEAEDLFQFDQDTNESMELYGYEKNPEPCDAHLAFDRFTETYLRPHKKYPEWNTSTPKDSDSSGQVSEAVSGSAAARRADAAMESGGKVTDAQIGEMEDWLKASENFQKWTKKPKQT